MNIYIDKISVEDRAKVRKWKSDPNLANQMMSHAKNLNESEIIEWITLHSNDQNQRLNGIYIKLGAVDCELVGISRLSFVDFDAKTAEFGIYIGDAANQGKGIGKKALYLTIDQAFNDLKLNKIYLRVNSKNIRSIRLYEKVGFVTEGILKEHYFNVISKEYEDVICMAIFSEGFRKPLS